MPDQNYAVPVRFAIPLLERAGWSLVEPSAEEPNANANANAAQPRPPATQPR